ncbi:MAG: oxidoreductase [Rhodospirillales bacterium]|nr:oxidoreductase [Rhodospirillales bacterium]MSP80280.1 oxidoreductase [Rhodospirillales bacterium]
MSGTSFKALVLEETEGKVAASLRTLEEQALPEGDVTVAIRYSTLNYKDGMIVQGQGKLVRKYPHVPGIDFAGVVDKSDSPKFKPGDEVVLTGYRVGEVHWGGFAAKARVKADWLIKRPQEISLKQAMALGTAGFTAMLAVMALEERGLKAGGEGEVLVTGAAGGVGSVSVALLSRLGHRVVAGTGRADSHDYLRDLGAATIVDRAELATPPKGPLGPERWSGAIDNVGGEQLGNILATLRYWGSCAAVGNAGGIKFTATVIPFLLRGINLLGIDSNTCPMERRLKAWARLARDMPLDKLDALTTTVGLADVQGLAGKILQGQVRGRTVIDLGR